MLLHGLFEVSTLNHNIDEYLTVRAAVGHWGTSCNGLHQWNQVRNRPYCIELQVPCQETWQIFTFSFIA